MKVLISAYACEPHKGSEPGAGWNWSLAAARDHEVWVLTRANNQEPIEKELTEHPVPNIQFVYVDLPRRLRWWKKGQRGVRLYYTLWQCAALRVARELHEAELFDAVHHLTFANMWYPSRIGRLGAPFVYGPVGGGVRIPVSLYGALGTRGMLAEVWLQMLRTLAGLNPAARRTWREADLVIAQNEETARRLRKRSSAPIVVRPHASIPPGLPERSTNAKPRGRVAICAGRLQPWKGTSLAIRAIAQTEGWTLEIIGRGSDRPRLERLVRSLRVEHRIAFTPWLPQRALWARLSSADALIVASLRDDAPLIVAEAASMGVPVVSFDQGGPAAMARLAPGAVKLVPLRAGAAGIAVALRNIDDSAHRSRSDIGGAAELAAALHEWYEGVRTHPAATSASNSNSVVVQGRST